MGYARSPFRDFESYPKFLVGLDEDDFKLILKKYNSDFIIYKCTAGIYTMNIFSKAVYTNTMGDDEGTLQFEHDDGSMKTKLILTRFVDNFGPLRFDERSFFLLHWVYDLLGL